MGFLWHKDTTFTGKICSILFIVIVVLIGYGTNTNFFPSYQILFHSTYITAILTILCFINSKSLFNKWPSFNILKKLIFGLFWFTLLYIFIYSAIVIGVPSAFGKYSNFGQTLNNNYVITDKRKSSSRRNPFCSYKLYFIGFQNNHGTKLCVEKEIWESIEIGEAITIVGKKMEMGIRVLKIQSSTI